MIISKLVNITTNRKWALEIYEQRKTERLTCVIVPLRNICYYFDPFFQEENLPNIIHYTFGQITALSPNCSFRS